MKSEGNVISVLPSAIALEEQMSTRSFVEKLAPLVLLALDAVAFALSVFVVGTFFIETWISWGIIGGSILISVLFLYLVGGYDKRTQFLSLSYTSEHLVALICSGGASLVVVYLLTAYHEAVKPSRMLLPAAFVVFTVASLFSRRILGNYFRQINRHRLVLGIGREGEELDEFFKDYGSSGFDWGIEVIAPEELEERFTNGAPYKKEYEVIVLACKPEEFGAGALHRLIRFYGSGVPVLTLAGFHERIWRRVSFNSISGDWIFDMEFKLSKESVYSHVKRLMDIVVSVAALLASAPFLLIVGLLIRLESKGDALFKQERIGRDGRPFLMYKLRTMRQEEGGIYTAKADPRVTRIGRFLRASRLDEIPQFWNVLKGDMSLIGPRAEWTKCVDIYEAEIPHYHLRHLAAPGITGWAQVNYSYGASKEDAIEKFQYDLYYIKHFSFKLDVCILLKTIHVILFGKGR